MQIASFSALIRSARVPIESIVIPSPQDPPATITKGARVNIDNDGVLVFVRSRVRALLLLRIHRSFEIKTTSNAFIELQYLILFIELSQPGHAKIKIYSLTSRNV